MAKVRLLDPTDAKRRLDRYELIGELASGGMATVFLGRLGGVGGFQRFVAIKRLHPHLANEEEFIEMFLDEARLAAGIHHPHVVPILEVGESESGYYLVMEYVEGDTLARLMARSLSRAKPVPRPVLVRIILDSLAGLHAAHEVTDANGNPVHLVHRDVSPQNILVGVDGCSRITDFGVAHAASRLSNTRADKLKGKLAYMSPEQARSAEIDRRSDVFAMGVILWEVLAGKRLFKTDNEAMTLQKVLVEPIPRLVQVAPSVHPAFDQVCAKALERDVSKRYRSAAEMAESLERAARTAAAISPTDLGVASPREVAAYVQGALGEDIAAQRESVRAWIAHSEPSMPRSSVRTGENPLVRPDVTVKVPIDKASRSGVASPPSSPGVDRESISASHSKTAPSPTAESHVEVHEGARDDDEEHETLLMDREAQNAMAALGLVPGIPPSPPVPVAPPPPSSPRRTAFAEESSGSASLEALAVAPRPSRRTPLVAVAVGLLLALGAFVAWSQLRGQHGGPPAPPAPAALPPSAPAPVASSAPLPVAAPSATAAAPAATSATAAAPAAPAAAAAKGASRPGPRGKPEPAKPAEPAKPEPAKPAEPAKPPEDMANPYR